MRGKISALLLVAIASATPLAAQEQTQVFRGARLLPISSAPIENGVLVVEGGKIVAVGEEGRVQIPANAVVHDVSGKVIMPGLVDTHSHIGGGDGGDRSAALHPDIRVLDAIDVRSKSIK